MEEHVRRVHKEVENGLARPHELARPGGGSKRKRRSDGGEHDVEYDDDDGGASWSQLRPDMADGIRRELKKLRRDIRSDNDDIKDQLDDLKALIVQVGRSR